MSCIYTVESSLISVPCPFDPPPPQKKSIPGHIIFMYFTVPTEAYEKTCFFLIKEGKMEVQEMITFF